MRRKLLVIILGLVVISGLAYRPIKDLISAARLVQALQAIANGDSTDRLPVSAARLTRTLAGQNLAAVLYRPLKRPAATALILIPGLSELGCYHPRLVSLCRRLAANGFLVLTPDIAMYRDFRIAPARVALDQISLWFDVIPELEGGKTIRKTGIAGISFSGATALMAAARPELRERAAFVAAIGGYDDPLRCSGGWFAAGPVTVPEGTYPNRFYAKWIIMMAAADMIPQEGEREFLNGVLRDLLLQKTVPAAPAGLSATAQRWYNLATASETESDPALAEEITQRLVPTVYKDISPATSAAEVRCSVFLIHGSYDDLIPPEESRRLQQRLIHAKSYLLISPFLTHTHPLMKPLPMAKKWAAACETIAYFYRFATVLND